MPNEQVLEGMYTLDLAHITHVRHREHRRFIAPGERVLARLLRAGAYDSVTHLMVEWPTEAELEAVAKLPKFEGLRLPKLFGLELDVTGATTLSHVLDLIGPEMESIALWGLHTVVRTPDELLHLGDHAHLENALLGALPQLDPDAESLDYSLGGVFAPLARHCGPWLDEPA
jgi:hypothetical protein